MPKETYEVSFKEVVIGASDLPRVEMTKSNFEEIFDRRGRQSRDKESVVWVERDQEISNNEEEKFSRASNFGLK